MVTKTEPANPDVVVPTTRSLIRWCAIAAVVVSFTVGLIQAAWITWLLDVEHVVTWSSRDFPWMAPLANIVPFFAAAGLAAGLAWLIRRFRPRVDPRRAAAAGLLFAGGLALAVLAARIHPIAQVIIALALAARCSRWLAGRPTRAMARLAAGLAVVVAALAVRSQVWTRIVEHRWLARLPDAAPGAPNVLLVILDTVRAASMSLYGYARETTPAIARWARDGVTFDFAFSTAPWTLPSHAGMFTGHDAIDLETDWRTPLDGRYPTLAEAFRDRGYSTAGFIANTYYTGHDSGLDRGFIHYRDYRTTLKQLMWSSTLAQTNFGRALIWSRSWRDLFAALRNPDLTIYPLWIADRKSAAMVTDEFLDWEATPRSRPFFAFLNYFDAHEVYKPPPRYRRLFARRPDKRALYDACLRYLDDQIDRLLSTLARRGTLDHTVVVIASDHGEYFGEHGLWGHGRGMHLEGIRVPLVIRYPPAVPAGRRVDGVISLKELAATITDLAHLSSPLPGQSLARFWGAEPPASGVARARTTLMDDAWKPAARRRVSYAVVTGNLHWIGTPETEELYAYRTDPAEKTNLIALADMAARRDSLKAIAVSGAAGGR